jgi:hypothetical protein
LKLLQPKWLQLFRLFLFLFGNKMLYNNLLGIHLQKYSYSILIFFTLSQSALRFFVSGYIVFAMARADGALIKPAVNRSFAGTFIFVNSNKLGLVFLRLLLN